MEKLQVVQGLFPMIAIIVSISIGGWVLTTWLRIKNGYPLDGAWGQALHPKTDRESMERIKLLSPKTPSFAPNWGRSRTASKRSSASSPTSRTDWRAKSIIWRWAREECLMGPGDVFSLLIVVACRSSS